MGDQERDTGLKFFLKKNKASFLALFRLGTPRSNILLIQVY